MPTSSMNGTTAAIHVCRSSSLVMSLKPYSSWMPCRLRASGRPNHSSVRMNIQSAAACTRRFSSRSAQSFLTHVRPWRRWKVSSLSTLASARFQGPNVLDSVDVGEQHEAGLVVERVGHHQLVPGVERHVEGVRVLERLRVALVDQLVHAHAEVAEQPVADVGMGELVLDDRDGRAEVVERRRVGGGAQVGRRAHELGVGGDREDPPDALQVLGRHVLEALDELARRQVLAHLVLTARCELFDRCRRHRTASHV